MAVDAVIMDEAKQSNDLAMLRADVDQAQKSLAEMKNHMSMCMNMMDRMEKTHGKGQKEKIQR